MDYMPIGTGVVLRGESDSLCGYFLGDVKWGKSNSNKGLGIITR